MNSFYDFANAVAAGRYFPAADGDDGIPKKMPAHGETLAEHLKHCDAKEPSSCPFVKQAAEAAMNADDPAGGTPPKTPPPSSQPTEAEKLKAAAAIFTKVFRKVGEDVVPGFIDADAFSVTPITTWDAEKGQEVSAGFAVTGAVNGGEKACGKFLDALSDAFGISRKPKDFHADDEAGRIYTHILPGEIASVVAGIEQMKQQKEAAEKAAAEAQKAAAEKAKVYNAVNLATCAVATAAKNVNFHVSHGDYAADKSKVDMALATQGDLDALADGAFGPLDEAASARVAALKTSVAEIKESYYGGTHKPVSIVPTEPLGAVAFALGKANPAPDGPKAKKDPSAPKKDASKPKLKAVAAPLPKENSLKVAYAVILAAAKSINHHIDEGDFTPNPHTLSTFAVVANALKKEKPSGSAGLLKSVADIEASAKCGFKKKIPNVKPL